MVSVRDRNSGHEMASRLSRIPTPAFPGHRYGLLNFDWARVDASSTGRQGEGRNPKGAFYLQPRSTSPPAPRSFAKWTSSCEDHAHPSSWSELYRTLFRRANRVRSALGPTTITDTNSAHFYRTPTRRSTWFMPDSNQFSVRAGRRNGTLINTTIPSASGRRDDDFGGWHNQG